jgi:hypothetical protein
MAVHERGWTVRIEPDAAVRFFDPRGLELPVVPAPARLVWDSATVLETLLTANGVDVTRWTGAATTDTTYCDYGLALDRVRRPHPVFSAAADDSEAITHSQPLPDDGDVAEIDVPAEASAADEPPATPAVSEGVEPVNWFAELVRDTDD